MLALVGCASTGASPAAAGGTGDAYSQASGHGESDLQYPEGDYRNILSANPF